MGRPDAERRIRVAQICCATDGAAWMVDLSACLQERGYDVLAIIASADGTTAAALTRAGVPFVATPQHLNGMTSRVAVALAMRVPGLSRQMLLGLRVAGTLGLALRMAWILRRHRIDIAHYQIFQSIIIGRISAWIARVPIRISQVPGPYHLEVPEFRRADLRTEWIDHLLIGGSGRVDELYAEAGIEASRRCVIRYGADPTVFDPDRADRSRVRKELGFSLTTPLVGQVAWFYAPVPARYTPLLVSGRGVKGHEDFVAAARIVLDERPDVRFLLVGGGWGPTGEEYRQTIVARCQELGIGDAVIFTGARQDIPDVLATLDVSVQCSLSENYGGTIESLMMRAPTIATRVGGMPEAVVHEETGLLVPPRDPPALAAAMLRLLDDPALGARLGAAGRERMVAGWTTQGMCEAVARVYAEQARKRLRRKQAPITAT